MIPDRFYPHVPYSHASASRFVLFTTNNPIQGNHIQILFALIGEKSILDRLSGNDIGQGNVTEAIIAIDEKKGIAITSRGKGPYRRQYPPSHDSSFQQPKNIITIVSIFLRPGGWPQWG